MRILFVTPEPPYAPIDGARRFVYHLAAELARNHELSLLSFQEPRLTSDYVSLLGRSYSEVHLLPRPRRLPRPLERIRAVVEPLPLWVAIYRSAAMERALTDVSRQKAFDVIHLDTGLLAQYQPSVRWMPAVIAPHDSMTLLLRELARVTPDPLRRYFYQQQCGKMHRYESRLYPRFQSCWVVSEVDRKHLGEYIDSRKLAVIPYGVDTDHFSPRPTPQAESPVRDDPSLGFVGVMDYPPNDDAALFFAREVLPLIWGQIPSARFFVIGRNPSRAVRALAQDPRVVITGKVADDDVRPWIAARALMVAPVRVAGGNKNKVFEALALGKALVCTPVCVEGLELIDGVHLLVGGTATVLAAQCIRLLRDERLRTALERNGREWALEHSWSRVARQAESLYLASIEKFRMSASSN